MYKVLRNFNINAFFCILDDYSVLEEDKKLIKDFMIEKPVILKRNEIINKTFIFVDHNDPSQSIKNDKCNVILSIDHHIVTNKVKKTISKKHTSTGLFIYDLFKEVYNFSNTLKDIVALTVMSDSCYLTTSRYKKSDEKLFKGLNTSLNVEKMKKKYFKTLDFDFDIDYNIKNSHKLYLVSGFSINRIIVKCYNKDMKYIDEYVKRSNELYDNCLFILNNFDEIKTYIYFKGKLLKTYNKIVTSSLITEKLISEIKEYL